ncbi:MAG: MerR family transcriptional regulator [Solirubrobacteraceae bacterium]
MILTMTRTFSIAEAASQAGVSIDAVRYYERAGLMLGPVERSGSGHRRYGERDVGWLVFLTKVRKTGMPIRRMREYAQLVRAGRGNEDQRLELLEQHRDAVLAQMEETRRSLDEIDRKIESYRMRMAVVENNLAHQPAA